MDANGNRNTTVYDLAGRNFAAVNPQVDRNTTVYNAASQPTVSLDAENKRTRRRFTTPPGELLLS